MNADGWTYSAAYIDYNAIGYGSGNRRAGIGRIDGYSAVNLILIIKSRSNKCSFITTGAYSIDHPLPGRVVACVLRGGRKCYRIVLAYIGLRRGDRYCWRQGFVYRHSDDVGSGRSGARAGILGIDRNAAAYLVIVF